MANTKRRVQYEVERTSFTHARMIETCRHALSLAEKNAEGIFYLWLTAMVFAAFTVEGYLNYAGQEKLSCWSEIERTLQPMGKLKLLSETAGFTPDFSRRPFQTFTEMFRLRQQVVHPKPEFLTDTGEALLSRGEHVPRPLAILEKHVTSRSAQRFTEDAEQIVEQLSHHLFGEPAAWIISVSDAVSTVISETPGDS